MSSYLGLHASLYDTFYKEKDYEGEAAFVEGLISKYGRGNDILELACGTGTHSLLLEKNGYHVSGIDHSEDMINQALRKKDLSQSTNDYRVGDMMAIPFEDGSFDNVICLFDSIGYVQTNENVGKVLSEINRVLNNDGVFIFEFWHAGAMIRDYDPLREKQFQFGNARVTRKSETTMDVYQQICTVNYTIQIEEAGQVRTISESMVNRFFLCQEMLHFLEANGFGNIRMYNGFNDNSSIDTDAWHIVCCANKL